MAQMSCAQFGVAFRIRPAMRQRAVHAAQGLRLVVSRFSLDGNKATYAAHKALPIIEQFAMRDGNMRYAL